MSGTQVLPLRPMTVGELLDAAASLLRSHWRQLLTGSFVLALVEQGVMTWMRQSSLDGRRSANPFEFFFYGNGSSTVWLWMIVGLFSEITIITVLGAPASRAMLGTLRGREVGWREMYARGVPWLPVLAVALIVGVIGGIAAAMCGLPWFLVYAFTGLIVPVMVIDGAPFGAAVGRGLSLAGRGGRAAGVRLLGYGSWLLVRLAVTCGVYMGAAKISTYAGLIGEHSWIVLGAAYLAINTVAYTMLACLDAATLVETRIRTEGLDIVLARAADRGEEPSLAPPRPAVLMPGAHPMPGGALPGHAPVQAYQPPPGAPGQAPPHGQGGTGA